MSALLRFENVACVRGGRLLFEGLDLALAAGEVLHLTGPNGSGKSSLIRLAAGVLKPAAGAIEASPAALADEHLALDRERTLESALRFWGGDVGQALSAFGIEHLAPVPVRLLSTGQASKARLARVLASGAPLWLLDEPLNGLDADGVQRLTAVIVNHRAKGGAVLAASHHPFGGDWRVLELGR